MPVEAPVMTTDLMAEPRSMRFACVLELERAAGGHLPHALAAPDAVDGARARCIPFAVFTAIGEPGLLRLFQRLGAFGLVLLAEQLFIRRVHARVPRLIELADADHDVMGVAVATGLILGAVGIAGGIGAGGADSNKKSGCNDDAERSHGVLNGAILRGSGFALAPQDDEPIIPSP